MMEYHKIQTAWHRDPETKFRTLIEGRWAKPEFEYLASNQWTFTEKVDGTNIRITMTNGEVLIGGRSDNAQIPAFLLAPLKTIGEAGVVAGVGNMTLYGEGYGAKIQKGGGNYRPDASFVLFDVFCGDLWLERENVADIALRLGISVAPIVGKGSLVEAIELARAGFNSTWGPFPAEGLVMRPEIELTNRRGERVISKIKCKDFQA